MGYRIQNRRDTAERWAEVNPILLEGEVGYVTDNPNQHKIGDGIHRWNDLPLRGYTGTIAQEFGNDENAVVSQKAVTEKLSELGSLYSIDGLYGRSKVSINTIFWVDKNNGWSRLNVNKEFTFGQLASSTEFLLLNTNDNSVEIKDAYGVGDSVILLAWGKNSKDFYGGKLYDEYLYYKLNDILANNEFENGSISSTSGENVDNFYYDGIARSSKVIRNDGGVISVANGYNVLVYYYNQDKSLAYAEPNADAHNEDFSLSDKYPYFRLIVYKNDYQTNSIDINEISRYVKYLTNLNKRVEGEQIAVNIHKNNYGVDAHGNVNSANGYVITKALFLKKDEELKIIFSGFDLGLLSLTDENNSSYKPVYSINNDSILSERELNVVIPTDGFYAISGRNVSVFTNTKKQKKEYVDEEVILSQTTENQIKGATVDLNGNLVEVSTYNYSYPILFKKGDVIDASCFGWDISILSKYENGGLIPIKKIEGYNENQHKFIYEVESSGYYVISWRTQLETDKYLFKIRRNAVSDTLKDLGGLTAKVLFEFGSIQSDGTNAYPSNLIGKVVRSVGYFVPFDGIISSSYDDVQMSIFYCDEEKKVRRIIEYTNGVPLPQRLDTSFPYARIILFKKDVSVLPSDFIDSIKAEGNGIALPVIHSVNGGTLNLRTAPIFEKGSISVIRLPKGSPSAYTQLIDKGFVYYGHNDNELHTPASITKVMSAIVACSYIQSRTMQITIKPFDIKEGSGNNLRSGDILKFSDLLYDVFLPSSNTATTAMARTVGEIILKEEGKSVTDSAALERFVGEMNAFAKEIGMETAHFDEPAGYPTTDEQKVSSKDALKMAMYAYSIPMINKTWTTRAKTINIVGNNSRAISLTHDVPEYYIEKYNLNNLVFVANKPGLIPGVTNTLVGVVHSLHSEYDYVFAALNTEDHYKQFDSIERAINYLDR